MKRFLTLCLALCLVLGLATTAMAEVPQDEIITITAEDYPNVDLSEHKTVTFVVITDTPDDYQMVLDYVNERLEGEFNTTLDFYQISWSDYTTMYPLAIQSGTADYDMVWTLPALGLYNFIERECIAQIDMDFVETYMPYSFKYQTPESWQHVTYKGKLTGIPQGLADAGGNTDMIAVRNDMLEKYGYDTINTWDDIRGIWMDIAADTEETGMLALAECGTSSYGFSLYTQAKKFVLSTGNLYTFYWTWKDGELPTPEEIHFLYSSDASLEAFREMKALADAGVWSRSAMSNTTTNYTAFSQGTSGTGCFNGSIYWYVNELRKNLGVESTVFVIGQQDGTQMVLKENYNQNCFSFLAGCQDMPRAAMVLDILKYDTDLNHTIHAGIEGYHRIEETPGHYTEGEHVAGWQLTSFCLSWNTKNGSLKAYYDDEARNANEAWMQEVGVSNPTAAFAFDSSTVNAYHAAVNAVVEEYRGGLRLGLVDDVDAMYNDMQDALNAAGFEAYQEEFISQYTEWYNSL